SKEEAREAARGQGLRLRQVPALSPPLRDQEPHRSARHRVQRTAGPPPLGGRAHAGVVQPLPAPGRTLRETRRHPRSLPLTRQCPHLPGLPREGVLIDTLTGECGLASPCGKRSRLDDQPNSLQFILAEHFSELTVQLERKSSERTGIKGIV